MDDFGDKLMLKTQKLLTDIKDIVESHDRPLPEETLYITTVHKGVSNVSLNVASALSFHHFLYHSSIPALRKREKIAYMQSSPAQAMFTCGYYVMYHGFYQCVYTKDIIELSITLTFDIEARALFSCAE